MINITDLGIKTVGILDDDLSINYTRDFLKRYVDDDCLDSLSDPSSPSRGILFSILSSKNINVSNIDDVISSFNDATVREKLPEYYKEGIVDVIESHKKTLRDKIQVIIDSLLALGVKKDNIFLFSCIEEARKNSVELDLLIIDLFLEEGKSELSLSFLTEHLKCRNLNMQYVLMSYSNVLLIKYFRELHVDHRVCSAQLKVISKPESYTNSDKIKWEQALYQIALERELIEFQRKMQEKWSSLISEASDNFIQKIWSLDNFGLNKLRLTAKSDDLSLADYLVSAMHKALLAEVENEGDVVSETSLFECKLQAIDDAKMLKPSGEIYDSYQELNSFIADMTSHRIEKLRQITLSNEVEDPDVAYNKFVSNLCYGSILQIDGEKEYLLHLTQPCDYIHVARSEARRNNLILFPGYKHGNFSLHLGGNKKHLSSFVYINQEICNIEWNLRMVKTFSMYELFEKRKGIKVVGRLRNDEAQSISHLFGSSMSRIATSRLPWFTNIECLHIIKCDEVVYHFFDADGQLKVLGKLCEITNQGSSALRYNFHIDKRLHERKSRFVVAADTNSISKIISSLSSSSMGYQSHFDLQDICMLGSDNMFTDPGDSLTFIFLSDFKRLFSGGDAILLERFKLKTNHHFFILVDK